MKLNFTSFLLFAIVADTLAFAHPKMSLPISRAKATNTKSLVAEFVMADVYKNFNVATNSFSTINDTNFYVRDVHGNITQKTTYLANFNNTSFYASQQTNNVYDSNNNLLVQTSLNNGFVEGNPLVNNFKQENTYDANNNNTQMINYFWVNAAWLPSQKTEYTFQNNIATTEILYSWDETLNDWNQSYRYTYGYNTNNQLVSVLGEEYTGGAFANSSQTTNITWPNTVEQTHPLSQTTQYWDAATSTWINQNKIDCQFDVAGNMISETNYYWDSASWKLQNFTDYTYNSNHDITSAITKVDTSIAQTGQLMIQKSIKNYYNSNFKLINDTIGFFDLFWGQLSIVISANNYTYNAKNNLLTDTTYTLNETTNAFEKASLIKNYYYANTTNLIQDTQASVSLFPNPVVNYLNVNNTTGNRLVLHIYNQLGKLVASETIENSNHTVDVSNYSKGIYLVQYTLPNGNVGTCKFVK